MACRDRFTCVGAFLLLALTLSITGCGDLLSLHALYTQADNVFDATLEGRWETDEDLLLVQRKGDLYELTAHSKKDDPSESDKYEMHLVDIKGVRFADLLGHDSVGHMFLKVQVAEDQLRIAFFDSEWLRQRIPHEEADIDNGKKLAVLTVNTPQLRSLVGKFAREPKAYDDGMIFRRAK
jgi:hypothetical protein